MLAENITDAGNHKERCRRLLCQDIPDTLREVLCEELFWRLIHVSALYSRMQRIYEGPQLIKNQRPCTDLRTLVQTNKTASGDSLDRTRVRFCQGLYCKSASGVKGPLAMSILNELSRCSFGGDRGPFIRGSCDVPCKLERHVMSFHPQKALQRPRTNHHHHFDP